MIDQINKSSKSEPNWKASASLISGIISVSPIIITFLTRFQVIIGAGMLSLMAVPIAIIGIIFGIMELKSTKKRLALMGFILSLIGLGTSIYIYLIALRVGQG